MLTVLNKGNEMINQELINRCNEFIDKEVGVSSWVEVTQDMTNEFGRSTDDVDPNHMDPEWASRNSPFGQTISYGFWTLSMLSTMCYDISFQQNIMDSFGKNYPINYGLEKVRFISPVPVGAKIRCRMIHQSVEFKGAGRYLFKSKNTIEIEGQEKPALTAEWLYMLVFSGVDGHNVEV